MPAMAVNAVLKRIASSNAIIDGVATHYKVMEINSLGAKHKAAFLEANRIMENSKKLLDDQKIVGAGRAVNEGVSRAISRGNSSSLASQI